MRDENMERSPQGEPKRSSRIAENQVCIFQIYLPEKANKNTLISELAQQAKNPAPVGAKSIYVDHEDKRYEKHRILVMQIISAHCEVLKFGYDNLGLVGEQMRNDVKPSAATPSHTVSYREFELVIRDLTKGIRLVAKKDLPKNGSTSTSTATVADSIVYHIQPK